MIVASLGWFFSNLFLYPAGYTTKALTFDAKSNIRHFVPTDNGMFGALEDADKQTVIYDIDGTLTGFANSTSINLYGE